MKTHSTFVRLLVFALVILAGAAAFILHQANDKAKREHLHEFEENGKRTLDTLEWILSDRTSAGAGQSLHVAAAELSKRLGVRITYISGGKVLAESDLSPGAAESMEDHSKRPEISEALKSGYGTSERYSTTVKARLLYMAKRVPGGPGLPDGVLRIAVPESTVIKALDDSRKEHLAVVSAMAACASLLAGLLLLRARGVLESFGKSVEELSREEIPDKIRVCPGSEFKPLLDAVNLLAKRARKSIRRLQETRSQLEVVLDKMTDAVAVLDQNGVIIMHNVALKPLVKCPRGAVEGCNVLDAGFGAAVFGEVDKALSALEPAQRRFQARLTAGGYADVELIPYLTGRGKRRIILVLHDVTALQQAGEVLREFVIDASHRLRTPLTIVQGYSATLLEIPPEDLERQTAMLEAIHQKSVDMGGVITSLLDKASPQAGPPTDNDKKWQAARSPHGI